ncbi:MAG: double-strand break repair helicase AddA [Chakrabartia sp.]
MAKQKNFAAFPTLEGEQAAASCARDDVWLSASAGTGKTQVLTARVLRLLLNDAKPESILCLTFTKAGAAEMAERIHERLGDWVRLSGPELAKDLMNLGEDHGPEAQAKARRLFAEVLDARGSGLRIQTIHSFCQTLLGSFPAEAGLVPGFRPIEGRAEAMLGQSVLADMVADAEREGRIGLIDRLQALALRMGEDAARSFLQRCSKAPDAMEALGAAQGIEGRVRQWLGLGSVDVEDKIRIACSDGGVDMFALDEIRRMNVAWGTSRAQDKVVAINDWLRMPIAERVSNLTLLTNVWAKADGELRSFGKGQAPQEPDYATVCSEQYAIYNGLLELRRLAQTAQDIANALIVGQDYARAYAAAKRAQGVVDFDDMIRYSVALLQRSEISAWISYKLDQATDHILIDEAQDTNAEQWSIVKALADEFYAGEGAKAGRSRTIFAVGDYKQAIFGFQGTDPNNFSDAQRYFEERARAADRDILDLSLKQSFRSSQPILDVVDGVIAEVGYEAMGMKRADPLHVSAKGGSGSVTLWPPVAGADAEGGDEDEVEEEWLSDATLAFAKTLAETVKSWISGGLFLRNLGRTAQPQDILILVRTRGDLARLIVSRLYEAGVPVAGVDRLRLNAPIVVQDMLACIRFALQPGDDLSLACLLVSPLVGWSQDELYAHSKGREKGQGLWQHLRATMDEELLFVPYEVLRMADRNTPYQYLEAILSGPIAGRRKFIARLGEEARDPIEELLNAAILFERDATGSLQLFLDWFDRGDVDIKRDGSKPLESVRVMTVHGAKGLQAPIVVLADATRNPDNKHSREMKWAVDEETTLPLFRPKKSELVASLKASADHDDARERQEHWRLLYVALTRAEEHLFIGGAMTTKQVQSGLGDDSWHLRVGAAMMQMGAECVDGAYVLVHEEKEKRAEKNERSASVSIHPLPTWLTLPAPEEARPPRPLAPSAIETADDETSPPPDVKMRAAAERGKLLHALFERLPNVASADRQAVAQSWLELSAGVSDVTTRAQLIVDALTVINDPDFEGIFAPDALAEAPLAGVVGTRVVAGTVDRLLVNETEVLVVDFKTGRFVPNDEKRVPAYHKAQMAAYAAVLSGIFPQHRIRAALLYTSGPRLVELPTATLDAYKPGYRDQQDKLSVAG